MTQNHFAIAIPSFVLGVWLFGAGVSFYFATIEERLHWQKPLTIRQRLKRAVQWPYWLAMSF